MKSNSESNQNKFQSASSWCSSKTGACICPPLPATAVQVCRQDGAKPIWKRLQQKVGGHQQQSVPEYRVTIRRDGRRTDRGRNHPKLCLPMYLLSLLSVQPWWGGLPPVYWLKIHYHYTISAFFYNLLVIVEEYNNFFPVWQKTCFRICKKDLN